MNTYHIIFPERLLVLRYFVKAVLLCGRIEPLREWDALGPYLPYLSLLCERVLCTYYP
jgi:hypothetical protein